jgi:hypothetical protein
MYDQQGCSVGLPLSKRTSGGVKVRFRSAYTQLCRTPNPTTSLILSSLYMLSLTVATTIARAYSSLACESMQLKENITGSPDIVSSAHDARTPGEYLASVQWDVKTSRRFEHQYSAPMFPSIESFLLPLMSYRLNIQLTDISA